MSGTPSLVIHAGVHKTGSTAIQHYFWRHADELARQGLLYPETARPEDPVTWFGHHQIAWAFTRRGPSPPDVLARLRREIEESGAHTAVVSSEELDRLDAPALAEIAAALPFPTRVVFYYRRQSEIIQGIYGTSVARMGEPRPFADFAADYDGALDFHAFAQRWASAFGRDNVIARPYDRKSFPGGNIVPDFLGALGLHVAPFAENEAFDYNASLPWYAVLSILRLRQLAAPEPLIEKVAEVLESAAAGRRRVGRPDLARRRPRVRPALRQIERRLPCRVLPRPAADHAAFRRR